MHPITLLLLINIGIVVYVSIALIQKKEFNSKWLDALKQFSALAAVWGTLSTLIGLFSAFSALEESPEVLPFQVIMGGLKVAVITIMYGLIVFCISMLAYIILRLANKSATV